MTGIDEDCMYTYLDSLSFYSVFSMSFCRSKCWIFFIKLEQLFRSLSSDVDRTAWSFVMSDKLAPCRRYVGHIRVLPGSIRSIE